MKTLFLILFFLSVFEVIAFGQPIPERTSFFINDYANILNDNESKDLEEKLLNYSQKSDSQIIVIIIKSLEGKSDKDYADFIKMYWKLDKNNKNKIVLILLAIKERRARIHLIKNASSFIKDSEALEILNKIIIPNF